MTYLLTIFALLLTQVADSTRWQAGFLQEEELIQENLNWSFAYFQKIV